MKKIILTTLCLVVFTMLYAQPSATPAAGFYWVKTGTGSYTTGAISTTPGIPDDTSFGINGAPPDSGSPYVQQQIFGNLGDARNTGFEGTGAGTNFPNSSDEVRTVTLTDWLNANPDAAVSNGATSGTVHLQTSATLKILASATPGATGTGAGLDEFRLEVIGGVGGDQSNFFLSAEYALDWSDTRFATSGGSGTQSFNQAELIVPDAGSGSNYEWTTTNCGGCNTWLFTPSTATAVGDSYGEDFNVTSLEDGGMFDVNFTGTASVSIQRIWGNADARVQVGPGMQGYTELMVEYDIWELEAILPVELMSFTATTNKDEVILKWTTASETNNSHFEIERSTDSRNWTKLAKITGAGTTTDLNAYSYIDIEAMKGVYYYRLKQVDFDGNHQYSNMISVDRAAIKQVSVFPNPVKKQLFVRLNQSMDSTISYQIYNANGQVVMSNNLNNERLDVSHLSKGFYLINVIDQTGTMIFNDKFVKQ